jgi:dipeptidyl aminopeptidase/acylaminoacyl peptidase
VWNLEYRRLRVRGAVSLAGIADLTAACELRLARGAVAQLLGGTPEEVPDRFAAASPAALVPIGVPVLCVHGALDATVPVSISESFAEKARLAGDEVELRVFDGEDHEGHLDPANAMWRAAAGWLDRLRR